MTAPLVPVYTELMQSVLLEPLIIAKRESQAGQGQSEDVSEIRKEILHSAQSLREGDGSLAARIDDWSQRMSEWTEIG